MWSLMVIPVDGNNLMVVRTMFDVGDDLSVFDESQSLSCHVIAHLG